jgi:glyoxylase-like metal-dependent hydrolase (beta-lactamase superfamily II)
MPPARDVDLVAPGITIWHKYDSQIKAELFSTAIDTGSGLFIVDPIELAEGPFKDLFRGQKVAGIVISNANHLRAAPQFAKSFAAQIFAHPDVTLAMGLRGAVSLSDNEGPAKDLRAIFIDGAADGEIALHCQHDGTLIFGDALINFGSHGFDFLPAKYCSNAKQMRRSLEKLLDLSFERILFAHGMPIVISARARLEKLLRGPSA